MALEQRVRLWARDIHDKYLEPPRTTDIGNLFLPTEGLYAEVLRRPGLIEALQRDARVCVERPTTLLAILSSIRMTFQPIAIQERSNEVWEVHAGVNTEVAKSGNVMKKVSEKLQEAANVVDPVSTRTRAIERKLRSVEATSVAEGEPPMLMAELPEESEQVSWEVRPSGRGMVIVRLLETANCAGRPACGEPRTTTSRLPYRRRCANALIKVLE